MIQERNEVGKMEHKIALLGFGGMAGWHFKQIKTIENIEVAGI